MKSKRDRAKLFESWLANPLIVLTVLMANGREFLQVNMTILRLRRCWMINCIYFVHDRPVSALIPIKCSTIRKSQKCSEIDVLSDGLR
ncbi:hypothetical protein TCAL_15823 [Tigriopus californicus]|uniref:Uncharacterized protein n=1 Tax=Tigriopus californicus TaxID=6832 RepID=A0A553NPL9_TIGCA|nr:hypothetical protein TCAL_15823 [Tigriopus californicus]